MKRRQKKTSKDSYLSETDQKHSKNTERELEKKKRPEFKEQTQNDSEVGWGNGKRVYEGK